ncbi:MAG: YkgJ family cysteine cluster protein [Vicinamibacteria bacterium]
MPADPPLTDEVDEDRALLGDVHGALSQAQRALADRLDFGRGCPRCCYGPFPINVLDARRLRRGLAELSARAPERAAAIGQRARAQAERYAPAFPGAAAVLADDDDAVEAFCARFEAEPCPVLDGATGRCELYDARPIACRTFGPPVRIGAQELPPCDWCFSGTPEDACRAQATVDPEGREDALLTRIEAAGDRGDTVIALALARA